MEELGGDQSLKESSEGVKEGKRCGLESSEAHTEGSGGDRILSWFLQPGWTQTCVALARIPTIFLRVAFFFVDFFSYLILHHHQ